MIRSALTCGVVAVMVQYATWTRVDSAQLTIVRGRVVAQGDDANAMRGARVTLIGSSATADPVFTDADGRFALGLPASYTLMIAKAGYAPAIVTGQATAAAGDLLVRLSRGAVLTGRVADALAFPVVNALVRARWLNQPAALRGSDAEFTAETDDRGEFRIGSLVAGRYSVTTERRSPAMDLMNSLMVLPREAVIERGRALRMVTPPKPLSEAVTVAVNAGQGTFVSVLHQERAVTPVDAPIGGAVTGTVVDEFGEPADRITVRLWRLRYADGRQIAEPTPLARRVDDLGQYRLFHVPPARYVVVAASEDPQHAPLYYPGVAAIGSASPVIVARRQELPGVHIAFNRTRPSRLSGIVHTAAGAPAPAMVNLIALGDVIPPPVRTNADAAGRFEFHDVVPGEYVVQAQGRRVSLPGGGLVVDNRVTDLGVRRVLVVEGDNAPVTVILTPTAAISGRVVTDDGRPLPSGLRLSARLDPEYTPATPAAFANIDADGRFEIRGLIGPARVELTTGMRGYRLKSFDLGGVNAAEEPVLFEGTKDSRQDVTAVLSSDVATIAGRVTGEGGRDPDDYRVIVFSVDRTRWFTGSAYVEITAGPNVDGGYVVQDLPPGDYWVAAVDAVEGDASSGEWQTPEFLGRLTLPATRVSAGARQRVPADLRLIRRAR